MSNPVTSYLAERDALGASDAKEAAAKADRKANELTLWRNWKRHGEQPEHLQPLLKLYEPVLNKKMLQWRANTVPKAAFKAELQIHLIKAFKNYDPTRGAALNTHVEHRLPKAMRYNNRYANIFYIPEGQSMQIGKINNAKEELTEELGREPTHEEIGNHMGMKPSRVKTIIEAQQRSVPMGRAAGEDEFSYTSGAESTAHEFQDQQIAIAQQILPTLFPGKPDLHTLFHYTFGTDGHPRIASTSVLAKKMGKSQSQISRMKTHMGKVLKSHMGTNEVDED